MADEKEKQPHETEKPKGYDGIPPPPPPPPPTGGGDDPPRG